MSELDHAAIERQQDKIRRRQQQQGITPLRRVMAQAVAPLAQMPSESITPARDDWADVDKAIDQIERQAVEQPGYRGTLLPDGAEIVAAYMHAERGSVAKDAFKWFALFEIVECGTHPESAGRVILRSWNEPKRGWLSPKAALARDFSAVCRLALRSLPPKASADRVLSSFLRGVWVVARTHVVTGFVDARTRQRVERHACEHYSVIDEITGIAAGSPSEPRFLARRRRRRA